MQIQLYVLKNVSGKSLVNVNEYVGFLPTTFSRYESGSFDLCYLAKVFLSTFENIDRKQYQKFLTDGDAGIVLTFHVSVCLGNLTLKFQKPVPHDSFEIKLTIYDDKGLKKATLAMEEAEKEKEAAQDGTTDSNNDDNNNSNKTSEPNSDENTAPIRTKFRFKISNVGSSITSLQISFSKKDCTSNSKEAAKSCKNDRKTAATTTFNLHHPHTQVRQC